MRVRDSANYHSCYSWPCPILSLISECSKASRLRRASALVFYRRRRGHHSEISTGQCHCEIEWHARDGRSWLDSFIVIMSLLSIVVTDEPTGFVRVLRALRVIRLFGRFQSLRKIISALSLAIVPVVNVFVILILLISIGA